MGVFQRQRQERQKLCQRRGPRGQGPWSYASCSGGLKAEVFEKDECVWEVSIGFKNEMWKITGNWTDRREGGFDALYAFLLLPVGALGESSWIRHDRFLLW